jgi:hypothetical protein
MEKRDNTWIYLITVIIVLAIVLSAGYIWLPGKPSEIQKYTCKENSDCVSQCSNGCVNAEWAKTNIDSSECFRAWDCSCVSDLCLTDGNVPKSN